MEVEVENTLATIRAQDTQIAVFEEQLAAIRSQDDVAHAARIDERIQAARTDEWREQFEQGAGVRDADGAGADDDE